MMLTKAQQNHVRSLATSGGHIEPADVVADARDPQSPLHGCFNWNVRQAAEAHWLEAAKQVIRLVRVEITVEEHEIRSVAHFVRDPDRPPKSKRYVDIGVVANDRRLAQEVIIDEMQRITSAIGRARGLARVLGLDAMLTRMLSQADAIAAAATRATSKARRSVRGGRGIRAKAGRRRARARVRV